MSSQKKNLKEQHFSFEQLYLTHSVNAYVSFVVRAGGAIFHLAGHCEEKVKVFRDAVQLTDVLICADKEQLYTVA